MFKTMMASEPIGEPTAAVQLAVSEGLFSVLLGDTTLGGMTQALTADADTVEHGSPSCLPVLQSQASSRG